jgi:hypothetical protein
MVDYSLIRFLDDKALFKSLTNMIDLVNKPITDIKGLIKDVEPIIVGVEATMLESAGLNNNPINFKAFKDEVDFDGFIIEYFSNFVSSQVKPATFRHKPYNIFSIM